MRRTLAASAAAALVSATLLVGCSANESTGGSNVEPEIDDPQATEDMPDADVMTDEATVDDMATMDMETTDG